MAPAGVGLRAISDTQAIIVPNPTTLPQKTNDRYARRQNADNEPRSRWGPATYAASALYKSPEANCKSRPKAKRWDDLLSAESVFRKPSSLKSASRLLATPGLISLGAGLPSSTYFPFAKLSVAVPTAPSFGDKSAFDDGILTAGRNDLLTGESIFDLSTAFNYGQGSGSAQLLRWVTEHTELVHNPPYQDWACNLTIGSTSAIEMILRMLANPGDCILAEEYTYPAVVEAAYPMGFKLIGVSMDAGGILPADLERILSNWTTTHPAQRKPRLLYMVPTGQNPTGATMEAQRRREIYALCQKHDIFILEDEPYYFLQMPEYGTQPSANQALSHQDFLKSLTASFLSMDLDGRVMRLDSFSKVVIPGARTGWVTGPEQLIERYKTHADCSTHGPNGFSQLVLFKVLEEHWGHGGYLDWLKHIRKEYTARRDTIIQSCERHLPKDVVQWTATRAGMFMEEQIFEASVKHGALILRGSWFYADMAKVETRMFFRATFAAAPFDKIDAAIQRFGTAVREVFGLEASINQA